MFLCFSPEILSIMGGSFEPTKEQLQKNPKKFKEHTENIDFVQKFGEIRGEKIKRIPKEWQDACKKETLIANKQLYFVGEEAPSLITSIFYQMKL